MFRRANGEDIADVSPAGYIPKKGTINVDGLEEFKKESQWDELFDIPTDYWLKNVVTCANILMNKLEVTYPKPYQMSFLPWKSDYKPNKLRLVGF